MKSSSQDLDLNQGRQFLDHIYASNGYFWYSGTRKEMCTKDALFDRLQTFWDQRLLEIQSQIAVKQKWEEAKFNKIDKLTKLRSEIGIHVVLIFIKILM